MQEDAERNAVWPDGMKGPTWRQLIKQFQLNKSEQYILACAVSHNWEMIMGASPSQVHIDMAVMAMGRKIKQDICDLFRPEKGFSLQLFCNTLADFQDSYMQEDWDLEEDLFFGESILDRAEKLHIWRVKLV